jgi:hypothetical protein
MDVPNKMEVAGMVAVTTTRLLYAMASIAKATQAMGVWATEGGRGPKALSEVALVLQRRCVRPAHGRGRSDRAAHVQPQGARVSSTPHTAEDRRARAAARAIVVLEYIKQHADAAIASLLVVVNEKGHALPAVDEAVRQIEEAQAKTIDAIANLRSSR